MNPPQDPEFDSVAVQTALMDPGIYKSNFFLNIYIYIMERCCESCCPCVSFFISVSDPEAEDGHAIATKDLEMLKKWTLESSVASQVKI